MVELYPDRIEGLDEKSLGDGPFRGVPFLIKDVFGHEKGRKIEFGSRLCEGMTVEVGTYFADMLKASGVNILGRSAAPEYSMAATTESAMFGNTSNPWKQGYSAGGSTRRRAGGRDCRHRADRARLRHRRLDPHSRQLVRRRRPQALAHARLGRPRGGRGRLGLLDESRADQDRARRGGHARLRVDPAAGRSLHHPQARRALCLACAKKAPGKLKVGIVLDELVGVKVDPEVAAAVRGDRQGAGRHGPRRRAGQRRHGRRATRCAATTDIFFFGFDSRLDGYAKRSGHKVGPDTLEPVISRSTRRPRTSRRRASSPPTNAANVARRKLGAFYTKYDIWLSPTTSRVSEPWGRYQPLQARRRLGTT